MELLKQQPIDLVLTDHRMPEMTGVELLAHCQRDFPQAKRILLTAYADLPEVIKARADRVAHHLLHKPCAPEKIARLVDLSLAGRNFALCFNM